MHIVLLLYRKAHLLMGKIYLATCPQPWRSLLVTPGPLPFLWPAPSQGPTPFPPDPIMTAFLTLTPYPAPLPSNIPNLHIILFVTMKEWRMNKSLLVSHWEDQLWLNGTQPFIYILFIRPATYQQIDLLFSPNKTRCNIIPLISTDKFHCQHQWY